MRALTSCLVQHSSRVIPSLILMGPLSISFFLSQHGILGSYSLIMMIAQTAMDTISFVLSSMNEPKYYTLLDSDPNPWCVCV